MADLTGTVLRDARLGGATLRQSVLTRTDLTGADLEGVDLSAALLRETRLDLAGAVQLAEHHGALVQVTGSD